MSTNSYSRTIKLRCDDNLPDNTAVVPAEIVPESQHFNKTRLEFGRKWVDARIIPGKNPDLLVISTDVFRKLNLYYYMQSCIKFENNKLKFGPLVGVLMNENTVRQLKNNDPTEKLERLVKAAQYSNVNMYFFTANDINWPDSLVNAVVYVHDKNKFAEKEMPLPDVLYDRGGGFTLKGLPIVREMRRQLNNIPEIMKINSQHYFDKWDLHEKLSRHQETKYYLPDTKIYRNASDLVDMLDEYNTVYLKKCTGSNGRGVIRVRKQDEGVYEYSYFKENVIKGVTQSVKELIEETNNLMNDKSFIIQEGIDVLTYQDNKVDLRVLVQRDGMGVWRITSIPVRIAVNDCAVTSTKSGSKVYQFDIALRDILGFSNDETEKLKSDIRSMMRTIVRVLEAEYGTFGELGIDVAIDKKNKLWFIESNAKPAKDTILIAGPESDINDSFRLPFEYAKFLTGFQN